jgi:peptidoglycan hydrolase CwlO-like protein
LENTNESLKAAKAELDSKQAELEAKLIEAQNLIAKIERQQEEYKDAIASWKRTRRASPKKSTV